MAGEQRDQPRGFQHLYDSGWRQGAMMIALKAAFAFSQVSKSNPSETDVDSARGVKEKERLVLVSHDCDIVNDKEEYVEALICRWLDPKKPKTSDRVGQINRNSPREFVVDPHGVYVAQAFYRLILHKSLLTSDSITLIPKSMDSLLDKRFKSWLARRYHRIAVADELHDHFLRHVFDVMDELSTSDPILTDAFNELVHEVRIVIPEDYSPPFQVGIVLLIKGDVLTEQGDEAIQDVIQTIISSQDSSQCLIPKPVEIHSLEDAPYGVILRSEPLSLLDYISMTGNSDAAMPAWLATFPIGST